MRNDNASFTLQITFESDLKITSMFSSEGEEVKLQEVMYPTGNVEDWMSELERIMKETLRLTLKDALEAYPKGCMGLSV